MLYIPNQLEINQTKLEWILQDVWLAPKKFQIIFIQPTRPKHTNNVFINFYLFNNRRS